MAETEACCNRTKRTTKKRKKKRVNFAADAKEKGELDSEINASTPKKDTKKAKRKFLFLSTLLGLLGYGRDRAAKNHATSSTDGGRGQLTVDVLLVST